MFKIISLQSPIIAISTPLGCGGIGIIKISGSFLKPIINILFGFNIKSRYAYFLKFKDYKKFLIDEGVVLFFSSPNSYTGEDILEFQGHGGIILIKSLLYKFLNLGRKFGIEISKPGEFTKRAFLNNRLDLMQAESISDIIHASSDFEIKSAAKSLSGNFSKKINFLLHDIVSLRTLIESYIDFPDEEIYTLQINNVIINLKKIKFNLLKLLLSFKQGKINSENIKLILIGYTNSGKSSLINNLSKENVSIVSNISGTTRDCINQKVNLNNLKLNIIDTAGLNETKNKLENIAINKTIKEFDQANVIINLKDINKSKKKNFFNINKFLSYNTHIINVFNKIDLLKLNKINNFENLNSIYVSVKNNININLLKNKILDILGFNKNINCPFLAKERHINLLFISYKYLSNAFYQSIKNFYMIDKLTEDLRMSHTNLNNIIGKFNNEKLLNKIFSKFCIGK